MEIHQAVNRVDAESLTEIKAKQYTGVPAQQRNGEGIRIPRDPGIQTCTKSRHLIISFLSKMSVFFAGCLQKKVFHSMSVANFVIISLY